MSDRTIRIKIEPLSTVFTVEIASFDEATGGDIKKLDTRKIAAFVVNNFFEEEKNILIADVESQIKKALATT